MRPTQMLERLRRNSPDIIVKWADWVRRVSLPFSKSPELGSGLLSPFFIVGSGRSGNTLLRRILSTHSRVCIPPELPAMGNMVRTYRQYGFLEWPALCASVLAQFQLETAQTVIARDHEGREIPINRMEELGIDMSRVLASCIAVEREKQCLAFIIDALFKEYISMHKPEADIWGDKTPWNVFHLGRLSQTFPNAQYIHILRDGRDSAASYVTSLNYSIAEAAARWVDATRKIERFRKIIPPENFIEVRYENLVANPTEICKGLCKFLDIEFESRMLEPGDPGALRDTHAPHHEGIYNEIHGDSVGRWSKILGPAEQRLLKRKLGRQLHIMGYE